MPAPVISIDTDSENEGADQPIAAGMRTLSIAEEHPTQDDPPEPPPTRKAGAQGTGAQAKATKAKAPAKGKKKAQSSAEPTAAVSESPIEPAAAPADSGRRVLRPKRAGRT